MKRHTQSLIETKAVEDSAGHAQPWPVALPEFFIGAFTSPGDMVIDFCLGSGTTMVAAQKLGRSCLGMELLPGFCDAIVMRMTKLFPLLPVTLLETGEDWGHVALRRKAVV
jgi:DNA modification methylase